MKHFTIENETNNITVYASAMEAETVPNTERFSNEAALTKLAADWPPARLVEIWNSLPGETKCANLRTVRLPYRGSGKRFRASARLPRWSKKPRWFARRLRLPNFPKLRNRKRAFPSPRSLRSRARCATVARRRAGSDSRDEEGHARENAPVAAQPLVVPVDTFNVSHSRFLLFDKNYSSRSSSNLPAWANCFCI